MAVVESTPHHIPPAVTVAGREDFDGVGTVVDGVVDPVEVAAGNRVDVAAGERDVRTELLPVAGPWPGREPQAVTDRTTSVTSAVTAPREKRGAFRERCTTHAYQPDAPRNDDSPQGDPYRCSTAGGPGHADGRTTRRLGTRG